MDRTFQNPIGKKGDFADPFILRYNGVYYLYCTNPDLRCWSSTNLIDWKLEGPVIENTTFPALVPFAPEVVYSNGKFYMYTSPSGGGHYVLSSESPTGPFRKISDNIKHSIDGSVFIDDDGKWYFYWADDEGIWGCEMKTPTELGEPVLTGASMHGWTEGPFVYKRNGIYYMTYTGNHYLSKGYRINAAWSNDPLKGYKDDSYNPVVIHTEGEVVGLGHSSTVIGPDLISHYIIYHNMEEDLIRDLDIDRQLWHEKVTQILGPTRTPQPAPTMPSYQFPASSGEELHWQFIKGGWDQRKDLYYSNPEDLLVLSEEHLASSFTAEFNLSITNSSNKGKHGIIIGENKNSFFCFALDKDTHSLQLWHNNEKSWKLIKQAYLPENFVFEALHSIRVEGKKDGRITIFVDNRLQLIEDNIDMASVRVGYYSEAGELGCGYTAITESTCDENSNKPLIPVNCPFYPVFGTGTFKKNSDGSILMDKHSEAEYRILADYEGEYTLFITCTNAEELTRAEVSMDNNKIGTCIGKDGLEIFKIKLLAGEHILKLYGNAGQMIVKRISVMPAESCEEKEDISLPISVGPYGKKLFGQIMQSDYPVKAVIEADLHGEGSKAGILLRVTEPSEGGEGADARLGIHFFIGYSVSFTGTELVIARHRYDKRILATCPFGFEKNKAYKLKVDLQGAIIKVYVNEDEKPRLCVMDAEPITQGRLGVWAEDSIVKVTPEV